MWLVDSKYEYGNAGPCPNDIPCAGQVEDLVFTGNVLVYIKEHFEDFDKSIYWLDKIRGQANNTYRLAFWYGGYDYVHFVCGVPYVVQEQYKLPRLCFGPGYAAATYEQKNAAWGKAMSTWLHYNIITIGCNAVC
ncbi:MAG: hypothetical protein NC548_11240 [Lachnospiraceae bacterium]|nr:hypothetical protein [Lachnospiraceae bacterium]MCM1235616.1 hypothetical protein [Ruminococcus flavefaciens]